MNKEIELVPGGGRYYRAMTFHWLVVAVLIVPVFVALLIAIVNPFWFRSSMFELQLYRLRVVHRLLMPTYRLGTL